MFIGFVVLYAQNGELVFIKEGYFIVDVQLSAIRNSVLICKKYLLAINIYATFENKNWLVTLRKLDFRPVCRMSSARENTFEFSKLNLTEKLSQF